MLFTEFQGKDCLEFGFPNSLLLSSEYRVPEMDESEVSESLIKSGEAEFYQAFFFYFIRKLKLKEFRFIAD